MRDALLRDGVLVNIGKDEDGELAWLDYVPARVTARLHSLDDPTIRHLRRDSGAGAAQTAPPSPAGGSGAYAPCAPLYRGAGVGAHQMPGCQDDLPGADEPPLMHGPEHQREPPPRRHRDVPDPCRWHVLAEFVQVMSPRFRLVRAHDELCSLVAEAIVVAVRAPSLAAEVAELLGDADTFRARIGGASLEQVRNESAHLRAWIAFRSGVVS